MNIEHKEYRFLNIPSGDLRLSITDKCNMACEYCHNEGQPKGLDYMSLNDILNIVDNSLKFGVHKVRLTGGEPTLHPDLIEICKTLKKRTQIRNLGINTNGYNRKVLIELAKNKCVDQFVFGIDYFDGIVSKKYPYGPTSKEVLDTVIELKEKYTVNVEIDTVYVGDFNAYKFFVPFLFSFIRNLI